MKKLSLFWPLIFSALLPILSVGCSTTWSKWKPLDGDNETTYEFKHDVALPSQYQVRPWTQLSQAYDPKNDTIDLALVNNHYELIDILGTISALRTTRAFDAAWATADWGYYANVSDQGGYFYALSEVTNVKLRFENTTTRLFELTIGSEIEQIISGFANYSGPQDKKYDVEKNGLSDNGTPKDFIQVAQAGQSLTTINLVSSLLAYKPGFALQLSKLVNLPANSFENFAQMIGKIDIWIETMFFQSVFKNWLTKQNVDLTVEENGSYYLDAGVSLQSLWKGKFLYYLLSGLAD
ncbi:hypothetical protein [Mycoplasma sp. ATU-Cv-508]|uniref:hypothetical protein n=1 Tax=Mycoplasma sp. ATU-Cv-508 TaxID=2048001 RepID=UPI000FDF06F0